MTRNDEITAARDADEKIAAAWALYWEARRPAAALALDLPNLRKRLRMAQRYAAQARTDERRAEENQRAARWESKIADTQERIRRIIDDAEPLAQAARELDAALYTGWQRFFLVEHIHSSQHCSSFRAGTRINWLPSVSGLTEAEAVAEFGAILCTICFPSAPVEWTGGIPNDGRCSGSGKSIDHSLPERRGFVAGNWVTCPDCGKQLGITRNGYRIPKHQLAA